MNPLVAGTGISDCSFVFISGDGKLYPVGRMDKSDGDRESLQEFSDRTYAIQHKREKKEGMVDTLDDVNSKLNILMDKTDVIFDYVISISKKSKPLGRKSGRPKKDILAIIERGKAAREAGETKRGFSRRENLGRLSAGERDRVLTESGFDP